MSNKIGYLKISSSLLLQMSETELRELFSNFFPFQITHDWPDIVIYFGQSPHFQDIGDGEKAPEYVAVFERDADGIGRFKEFKKA